MSKYTVVNHPSFGSCSWSRVTGEADNMFMSSLSHDTWIELEVMEAESVRRGNETHIHSNIGSSIVRVRLTEAQFAQFITTPNRGVGTPCTITRREGASVPQCPPDEQLTQFRNELRQEAEEVTLGVREVLSKFRKLLHGKTLKKGDLRDIESQLEALQRNVEANLPFLVQQFNHYMDGVYLDAVSQFEGHVKQALEAVGLEHLNDRTPKLT